MGQRNGPYREEYPIGTTVRIKSADVLQQFYRSWKFHHPLTADQLAFFGRTTTVKGVSFYHGGDELYELADVPGIWHEELIEPV
ncbi:MAG: hypothetical protein ROO76_19375 [Terriglobia bacterium]|nr:hypothetical protein [Terriglobia bacterium]